MKIIPLVENISNCDLKPYHGLSLYIETKTHKILFDLGPNNTLFKNAKLRNIDLKEIDTVIISHGHIDHAGALKGFLLINQKAKIYIQKEAFNNHTLKFLFLHINVGIDKEFINHHQVVLLDNNTIIDEELSLFTVSKSDKCYSLANNSLYQEKKKDNFNHEQNLIIKEENKTVLIMGCGHKGIVNILEEVKTIIFDYVIGGYHLMAPFKKNLIKDSLLDDISKELSKYTNTLFYTCHCTGLKAYKYLKEKVTNLNYLSCGLELIIE